MNLKWVISVMAVLVSFSVMGKEDTNKDPAVTVVNDPVAFQALRDYLQKQMEGGGRYEFVKADEHKRINVDLQKIQDLLDKQASGTKLSADEVALQITAQSEVNSIFGKRDGERLVCENAAPLGSHLPKTTCITYSEQQRKREATADYLRQAQKPGGH